MNTIALRQKLIYHKIISIVLPKINWKLFYFLGIVTFSLVLVFYIISINELTKGVYLIKKYNKEISNLVYESKMLENTLTNNNFLIKTQERAWQLSFEKTKDIKYIQILEGALVQK